MNNKMTRFTGYALTGAFTLFMLFDVGIKLMRHPMVANMGPIPVQANLG